MPEINEDLKGRSNSFEMVLDSEVPVGVFFWADGCKWSKHFILTYDIIASSVKDRAILVKVNVDSNPEIAEKYGVGGTPTIKFFFLGRNISQLVGYVHDETLREEIEKVIQTHRDTVKKSSSAFGSVRCEYCGETVSCDCCIGLGSTTGG